jgi:hypothetical protein
MPAMSRFIVRPIPELRSGSCPRLAPGFSEIDLMLGYNFASNYMGAQMQVTTQEAANRNNRLDLGGNRGAKAICSRDALPEEFPALPRLSTVWFRTVLLS